jgi:hypothetical protein
MVAAHQETTRTLWPRRTSDFETYISANFSAQTGPGATAGRAGNVMGAAVSAKPPYLIFNLERAVARQRIVQLIHSHRFTEKPRRTLRVRLRFFSNR